MGDYCIHNLRSKLNIISDTSHETIAKLFTFVITVILGICQSLLVVAILEMCKWVFWGHKTWTLDSAREEHSTNISFRTLTICYILSATWGLSFIVIRLVDLELLLIILSWFILLWISMQIDFYSLISNSQDAICWFIHGGLMLKELPLIYITQEAK